MKYLTFVLTVLLNVWSSVAPPQSQNARFQENDAHSKLTSNIDAQTPLAIPEPVTKKPLPLQPAQNAPNDLVNGPARGVRLAESFWVNLVNEASGGKSLLIADSVPVKLQNSDIKEFKSVKFQVHLLPFNEVHSTYDLSLVTTAGWKPTNFLTETINPKASFWLLADGYTETIKTQAFQFTFECHQAATPSASAGNNANSKTAPEMYSVVRMRFGEKGIDGKTVKWRTPTGETSITEEDGKTLAEELAKHLKPHLIRLTNSRICGKVEAP